MLESEKRILRINMTDLSVKWEDVKDEWKKLGGRGLTSTIVSEEVPPTCEPLGPFNKLVVAPGIVTGSTAPSTGRLSVGAKSPLTNGIKEANAGGRTPHKLSRAGVKAIIFEGMPKEKKWYNILIKKGSAEIVEADEYHKMGAYELIKKMWEKYPSKPGVIGSGPAGQMLLKGAGVFGNNVENSDPGRYAGRGGLGAVLGSKGIIAIITDDSDGDVIKAKEEEKFKAGSSALREALVEHPVTGKNGGLQNYGTNVLMNVLNEAGSLPAKNWTLGHVEDAVKISGEATHERIDLAVQQFGDKTNAQYAHACNPGCVMKCSMVIVDKDTGEEVLSPLEYESSWSLGNNTLIHEYEDVVELNRICNDLGLDTIEAGNALAVAMDAGQLKFGDGKGAIKALKEVGEGTPMGRILGSGALTVGNVFGSTRVAHVKGQSMPAYDPRPIKGIGVTYATGTMGADHTQGYTIAAEILGIKGEVTDPRAKDKAALSKAFQETTAFIDSSGYCLFTAFAILDVDSGFQGMVDTVAAMLGIDFTLDDVTKYGREILDKERAFNFAAGMTNKDDRLPEFMKTEALPPHNVVFDVTDEELDAVHNS